MTFPSSIHRWGPGLLAAVAGGALFHFWGNASRGYIDTASLWVWWGAQWLDPAAEAEHGWLILALSGWLFWRQRGRWAGATSTMPWRSGRWFAAALVIHALGFYTQQARVSILGLLLYLWAWLGLVGGRPWARAAWFPVAFLTAAIPVSFLDTVGFWLRLGIVRSAATLAEGWGWPVLLQGTRLLEPGGRFHYDVDYACAGVRSLVAILAVSLVVGYVRLRPRWLRAAVVAAALPVTYVANVGRLLAIIGAGYGWGQEAGSVVHDVGGYVVYVVVLGAVYGLVRVLEPRFGVHASSSGADERGAEAGAMAHVAARSAAQVAPWRGAAIAVVGSVLLMVALSWGSAHWPAPHADIRLTADGRDPVDLPAFPPGDWIGRRAEVSAIERQILPPDTGFSRRVYVSDRDPAGAVLVSVVLSGRDRSSIHRPELCLVGQGWSILGSEARDLDRAARPSPEAAGTRGAAAGRWSFPVTLLRLERKPLASAAGAVDRQLAAYWFVGGGRIVRSHWERMAWDVWARLRGRPIRWAYVLAMTAAPRGDAEALARMQAVLNEVLPALLPAES